MELLSLWIIIALVYHVNLLNHGCSWVIYIYIYYILGSELNWLFLQYQTLILWMEVSDWLVVTGTIAKGAALLHQEGAREVYACSTHAVFRYVDDFYRIFFLFDSSMYHLLLRRNKKKKTYIVNFFSSSKKYNSIGWKKTIEDDIILLKWEHKEKERKITI